jgi:predicted lipoprotein
MSIGIRPRAGWIALLMIANVALAACRKPPPGEHVTHGTGPGDDEDSRPSSSGAARADGGGGAHAAPAHGDEDDGGALADASTTHHDPGGGIVFPGGGHTDGGTAIPETPPFTKRGLLTALGDCALAQYRDFEDNAHALAVAAQGWAKSADDAHVKEARAAWRDAMASWQRAELFRFGPAASSTQPGGADLRDQIYIYPLANACKVDQQIVDQSYAAASFPSSLASARGLSALEYLLFYDGDDNSCLSGVGINANGTWDALDSEELRARRAAYASAAAKDVYARARALVNAWDPKSGDFYATWTQAGDGNAVYASDQDAFNAAGDALFYVEQEVKDWKLGWPLGLVAECANAPDPCPDAIESRYAHVSTDGIRQNLLGFRRIFQGCGPHASGLGFDDWLRAVGDEGLAERMLAALDHASDELDALDPALEQAITTDPSKVTALHKAIKALTDLLKTELITVLNLELPKSAEGDND